MAGSLDAEIALVTGGGRGIGRAIEEAFAEQGASVTVMARSRDQVEEAAQGITSRGGRAIAVIGDVTSASDVQRAVDETQRAFGGSVSVLVSNAGITGPYAPIWDADPDEWWRTQDVHVHGAFLCTRAVLPGMIEQRWGRVINIASQLGQIGGDTMTHYTASKAGILGLTRTAALELAPHSIRVIAICPGGVSTPMNEHEKEGGVIPETPLRRRAHVSEIASTVAFLASDEASFITGTEIFVDGGFMAR